MYVRGPQTIPPPSGLWKTVFHETSPWCRKDWGQLIYRMSVQIKGLPWWISGKDPVCQCRRWRFDPWVRKIPQKRKWQPTPVFLPGKSQGQRSLMGHSPWGQLQESWTRFSDQTDTDRIAGTAIMSLLSTFVIEGNDRA